MSFIVHGHKKIKYEPFPEASTYAKRRPITKAYSLDAVNLLISNFVDPTARRSGQGRSHFKRKFHVKHPQESTFSEFSRNRKPKFGYFEKREAQMQKCQRSNRPRDGLPKKRDVFEAEEKIGKYENFLPGYLLQR